MHSAITQFYVRMQFLTSKSKINSSEGIAIIQSNATAVIGNYQSEDSLKSSQLKGKSRSSVCSLIVNLLVNNISQYASGILQISA